MVGTPRHVGSRVSVISRGRDAAARRMTETVTVGVFEDGTNETGDPIRVPVLTRYESKPGRIKYESLAAQEQDGAGSPVAMQTPHLSVPTGSPRFHEGDEVVVFASAADELLVGRRYRVTGSAQAGQTTAHRYPLEELS